MLSLHVKSVLQIKSRVTGQKAAKSMSYLEFPRVPSSYHELPRVTTSYHQLPAKQKRINLKIKLFFISLVTRGKPW